MPCNGTTSSRGKEFPSWSINDVPISLLSADGLKLPDQSADLHNNDLPFGERESTVRTGYVNLQRFEQSGSKMLNTIKRSGTKENVARTS